MVKKERPAVPEKTIVTVRGENGKNVNLEKIVVPFNGCNPDQPISYRDLSTQQLDELRKALRSQKKEKERTLQRIISGGVDMESIDASRGMEHVTTMLKNFFSPLNPLNSATQERINILTQLLDVEREIERRQKEKYEEEKKRRLESLRSKDVTKNCRPNDFPSVRITELKLDYEELDAEVDQIRVSEETFASRGRISLPNGSSLQMGVVREQEIPDKIDRPSPSPLWRGYVHLNRRKDDSENQERELVRTVGVLKPSNTPRGFYLDILDEGALDEYILKKAREINKKSPRESREVIKSLVRYLRTGVFKTSQHQLLDKMGLTIESIPHTLYALGLNDLPPDFPYRPECATSTNQHRRIRVKYALVDNDKDKNRTVAIHDIGHHNKLDRGNYGS